MKSTTTVLLVCSCLCILYTTKGQGQLYGPNRQQTISNIFQIPIQTLSAISNVAQNTRPFGETLQQRQQRRRGQNQSQPQPVYQASSNYQYRPQYQPQYQQQYQPQYQQPSQGLTRRFYSRAAEIAGLYAAQDGSHFRI